MDGWRLLLKFETFNLARVFGLNSRFQTVFTNEESRNAYNKKYWAWVEQSDHYAWRSDRVDWVGRIAQGFRVISGRRGGPRLLRLKCRSLQMQMWGLLQQALREAPRGNEWGGFRGWRDLANPYRGLLKHANLYSGYPCLHNRCLYHHTCYPEKLI